MTMIILKKKIKQLLDCKIKNNEPECYNTYIDSIRYYPRNTEGVIHQCIGKAKFKMELQYDSNNRKN